MYERVNVTSIEEQAHEDKGYTNASAFCIEDDKVDMSE